jgi:hypothetical protein
MLDEFNAMSARHDPGRTKKSQKSAQKRDSSRFLAGPELDRSVAALSVYQVLARGSEEEFHDELTALIHAFLTQFSPDECIDVVLGRVLAQSLSRRLAGVVKETVPRMTLKLTQRLLEAPAVRIEHVAQVVSCSFGEPSAFLTSVATVVARGLGASQVEYEGKWYEGFWTLNPDSLRYLLENRPTATRRARPKTKLQTSQVSLDPFLLELIQIQGRSSLPRKGRPKRLKSRP